MDEIATKIHFAVFALVLIFVGTIFIISKETVFDDTQQVIEYVDGWEENEEGIFCNYLPSDIKKGSGISFFTKNKYLEVYVEDKIIYAFLPSEEKRWETPGNRWHFVELSEGYEGKKVILHFYETGEKNVQLPDILFGNAKELFRKIIVRTIVPLFLSFSLVFAGFIYCIGWGINRKKVGVDTRILYLGLFTMGIGILSGIQTQALPLLLGNSYDLTILMNFLLLFIQYPVMKFTVLTYGGFIDCKKCIFIRLLEGYLFVLSLTGLGCILKCFDISTLGKIAYIYFGISGIIIIVMMWIYYKGVNEKRKKRLRIHLAGLLILTILFFIDNIRFFYFNSTDGATFSRLGVCAYLTMLSVEILLRFIKRISMSSDSEQMKNMAYCDALTCMGNRTSFMKNIHEINREDYEKYGIAMFDLNNLKLFNDVHGHSAGDYYLIISSEIIRDIFGQKGETYRIGGDEFCAVLRDCSLEEFMKGAHEMQERLSQLKGPYTKEEMSIAYGYEKFDKQLDNDLSNTMERADSSMYTIKERIKKQKSRIQRIE